MNPLDERMHPVGDAPAWSESYYFNFVDPDRKIGMFTRMGFRPGDGWADGLHAVYLGGDRVAFTYGRRDIEPDLHRYDHDLTVGGLSLVCVVPFRNWEVGYQGPAQDIADAAVLLTRRKARPQGWYEDATLEMTVDFNVLSDPHYAANGAQGHFEQTGSVRGNIDLLRGERRESFTVSGFGVRDKSWGPRDWGAASGATGVAKAGATGVAKAGATGVAKAGATGVAKAGATGVATGGARSTGPAPFVNWFSMNFGPALAMGGSCFRHADGALRGAGWIHRDGRTEDLVDVVIESEYRSNSIWHTAIRLTGRTASGAPIDVAGRILTVCPTKIPMAGGATFVNEGLAEFTTAGMTGYGISEHWHAVRKDEE